MGEIARSKSRIASALKNARFESLASLRFETLEKQILVPVPAVASDWRLAILPTLNLGVEDSNPPKFRMHTKGVMQQHANVRRSLRRFSKGVSTVVSKRWFEFSPESKFQHPTSTSILPLFNLFLTSFIPHFHLCSAGNLEPRFGNHGLQTLGFYQRSRRVLRRRRLVRFSVGTQVLGRS